MRDRFLWIGCVVYAALFTALGALKYTVHRNLVDFGIFEQTTASAFGCFCSPIEGSHWAFHFSPILYAVGAVVALLRTPLALVALSAIAGALVAPPVYGLVRRTSANVTTARVAALVAWLYPPLAGLVFGDFHENNFAPAAVAWTLYAFDGGMLGWTLFGAIVAMCVKEDQAIFLGIAGILGAWKYRMTPRGHVAASVAGLGALVCVVFFLSIAPHAAAFGALHWQPDRFYAWTLADVRALPASLAARAGFLALILVPLLLIPLRSPLMLLAIAPLAEVLLSRMPTTYTVGTHYAGAWIGYVLVAFADGLRTMPALAQRRALAAAAVLCALEIAVADPLHPGLNLRRPQPRDVELERFLPSLPGDASVATQEEAYTHLALADPYATLLPENAGAPERACFILIDTDFPESARLQEYGATLQQLVAAGRYVPVVRSGGIELYRRAFRCI